ncbi:MAG: hypothetical protein ABIG44_15630 [Planctomycetota bacterium]
MVAGYPHHITQRGNRRPETCFRRDDDLVKVKPLLDLVRGWKAVLSQPAEAEQVERFRKHAHTGRPLGDENFAATLSKRLGRIPNPRQRGPEPKAAGN